MKFLISTKIDLREKLVTLENYDHTTVNYLGKSKYIDQVEEAKLKIALAMSVEPTFEGINSLESEVTKGTELEIILLELKDITIKYTKAQKIRVLTS